MARLLRKPRRLDPAALRLPLIALIDVVLFLLMYFMVAGTLGVEEKELAAALAVDRSGGTGGQRSALLPTILNFERDTRGLLVYRLGERSFTSQSALQTLLQSLPKDAGVVLRGAANTNVGDLASAMQACTQAGFVKISFVGK